MLLLALVCLLATHAAAAAAGARACQPMTKNYTSSVLIRSETHCSREQQMACVAEAVACGDPCYHSYEDGNWVPCLECFIPVVEKCCDCLVGDYVDCQMGRNDPKRALHERFGRLSAEMTRQHREKNRSSNRFRYLF